MKVLIISQNPWRLDNSFGNSFDNIFSDIPELELAQICCGPGLPNTKTLDKFYYMNERLIVHNVLNKSVATGISTSNDIEEELNVESDSDISKMKFFQKNRFRVFFWGRELIWKFGKWNSKDYTNFIKDFNPDIVFLQLTIWPYVNRIGLDAAKRTNAKLISYISDDNYTLKQFSLNPFYWLDRLVQRSYVGKVIRKSDLLYVISKKQKREYDKIFNIDSKILFKSGNFDKKNSYNINNSNALRFLFTGNIAMGRYQSLYEFGEVLDKFNKENNTQHELIIFTNTSLKDSLIKQFSNLKFTQLNSAIPFSEVIKQQKISDVLVHVESFQLKEKLSVRHSFSTKLVDYFNAGKPILAIGPGDIASIEYLEENNSSYICKNKEEMYQFLNNILINPEILKELSDNSFACGSKNHDEKIVKTRMYNDFKNILKR